MVGYIKEGRREGETGTRSVKSAAAEVANGESEQRVVLSQELGSASVESNSGSEDTESTASLSDRGVRSELGNGEKEESEIKAEEQGDQSDVDPQGTQPAEERRTNEIRSLSQNRSGCCCTHKKMNVTMNQAAKKMPIAS